MGAHAGGPTLIQSVQRALRLLEVLAEHSGRARAKELARATGLPLATTYHLLRPGESGSPLRPVGDREANEADVLDQEIDVPADDDEIPG